MTKIPKEVQEFMQGKMGWVANLHFKSMGDEMSKTAALLLSRQPGHLLLPKEIRGFLFPPRGGFGFFFLGLHDSIVCV